MQNCNWTCEQSNDIQFTTYTIGIKKIVYIHTLFFFDKKKNLAEIAKISEITKTFLGKNKLYEIPSLCLQENKKQFFEAIIQRHSHV